jgi:hypothetical protein
MSSDRERRLGMNEALFREVNERINGVHRAFAVATETMSIVCECGARDCIEHIPIAAAEYERVRSDPSLFAIVPGHETPDVEDVVERHETFDVVRKHAGIPQSIAEATDPRTPD